MFCHPDRPGGDWQEAGSVCARDVNGETRVVKPTNTVVTCTAQYPHGGHHLLLRLFWQKMSSAPRVVTGTSVVAAWATTKPCTGCALSEHLHLVGCGACGSQRLQIGGRVSAHVAPSSGQGPSVADSPVLALAAGHDQSFEGLALWPPWAAQVQLVLLLGFWPWPPLPNRSACDLPLQQLLQPSAVQHWTQAVWLLLQLALVLLARVVLQWEQQELNSQQGQQQQ